MWKNCKYIKIVWYLYNFSPIVARLYCLKLIKHVVPLNFINHDVNWLSEIWKTTSVCSLKWCSWVPDKCPPQYLLEPSRLLIIPNLFWITCNWRFQYKYSNVKISVIKYETKILKACEKTPIYWLRITQKALQLPLFSFFFSKANLDGLTKVTCQIFYIC